MRKIKLIFLLFFASIVIYAQDSSGVSINTGVDFVSSYNWRAIDFGNSPSIQPYIGLSAYGIEFTIWGSYAFIANEVVNEKTVPFTEVDLILRYNYAVNFGILYSELVDFYYPFYGKPYSDYKEAENGVGGGSHWTNLAIGYKGTETFPISLKFDFGIHNDADNNIYFEAGYNFKVKETNLDLFLGMAKGQERSELYGIENDKVGLINAGVTVSKRIKITDSFSLPVSTQLIVNPYTSKIFLVFKTGL
jgi:hypothetical protein